MSSDQEISARDWGRMSPYREPGYKSTQLRGPTRAPIVMPQTLSETTGPALGYAAVTQEDADLTTNARRNGEPIGERIIVTGKVMDENGRGIANSLVEIWQANAAGRYLPVPDHPARGLSMAKSSQRLATTAYSFLPDGDQHP